MAAAASFTTDDLICVCISRQIEDGQILAQGIATPPVAAGYFLAKLTHAPNVIFASAIGNTLCQDGAPLALTVAEDLWLGKVLMFMSFAEAACELYPTMMPVEFFRPAQVDPFGNTNNIAIGDHRQPRLRLPGCGGIADVTVNHPHAYLYVPRHSRAVFVEELDLVSGLGVAHSDRPGDRPGPRLLISELGVFDFATGRMRLVSYHPGVTVDQIRKKTGFPLDVAPDVHETAPPTGEEIRLLREEIDPLGIRDLDRMSGSRRRRKMREIIQAEAEARLGRSVA
ncbi:MAG: CoA-transferase subunit beta [Anaerolineae bacterium]|jgi:acyl CoA:acetate/3-ketoacid CoA transferase beta subunit